MLKLSARARINTFASGCFLTMLAFQTSFSHAQSVLTQHNDNNRDGVNALETVLTPSNVNVSQFGMLFKVAVDDQVFAQPLVDNGVSIAGGTHSVVYVATANNSVYAFDANSGAKYWQVNLGTAFTIQNGGFTCQDVLASSGIMSTPVIDTNNNTLYVVAETYVNGTAAHKLHALNLSTGADQSGSPVQITASEFNSVDELQRPGLLLANGNIYFSFAGHCDQGSWKGLTFAYNATTLAQVAVFNASPSDNGAGIWQSGNGLSADSAGNVYIVTGNGTWDGESNFSETFLKTGANLNLLDWHTPSDYASLDSGDEDLTSSGALLMSGTSLVIAGGKDGVLHLVNTGSMGHLGDSTAVQNWTATSSHIHSMNYWNSNLYLWGQSDYLRVYKFNGSTFNTTPEYELNTQAIGHPGGSISISANGTTNGILWAATNSQGQSGGLGAWHMTEPGILYAYNASNMNALWNNEQNATRDDCNNYAKFTAPTISSGKVYLASFGTAQTESGQLCVYGELPAGTDLIANGNYVITSVHSGQAIDDPGSSTEDGKDMQQYTVNNGTNQQWTVTNLGGNVITLRNVASGQMLDVAGASKSNSALVDQWPANGQTNQEWNVTSLGGGDYELTSVNSGQALDVDGGGITVGEKIDQYPYQSNTWQQWKFTSH
ncbi:RICIN domain-containing protein [Tunturiibacter psychrotolerans]|uniref:RICIN domain-containing protein n=1 Tax=Tunturiibacter psychrotolerans TaxID=3069686 RepID=UPI003D23822D